jgi:hypothetical protein
MSSRQIGMEVTRRQGCQWKAGGHVDMNKRLLHWTARILTIVSGLFLLVFFLGEAIAPAAGVGTAPGTVDPGSALGVGDSLSLVFLVAMILGFLIAWWWPVIGGTLILFCAIVIPSTIVFQRSGLDITQIVLTGGIFGLFALTGVLDIADGVWGNRGGAYLGEVSAP